MHYILNTTFSIPVSMGAAKIGGPTIPGRPVVTEKFDTRKFIPGVFYTLTYIKKLEKNVKYTFKGSDGNVIEEYFDSCKEADVFISRIKGETLPNYTEFYQRLKS